MRVGVVVVREGSDEGIFFQHGKYLLLWSRMHNSVICISWRRMFIHVSVAWCIALAGVSFRDPDSSIID